MPIYIVRHTEVDIPKGTCYGHLDVALKKNSDKDFAKIKNALPKKMDQVFSSPSQRCQQLAHYLDKNYKTSTALKEYNFGDWEGQLWTEIPENELKTWGENFVTEHTPKGENMLEFFKRTSHFFDNLRQNEDQNIVIVSHAGVIRCLIANILQIPLENIFKIQIGYGKIYKFNLNDDPQMDQWFL